MSKILITKEDKESFNKTKNGQAKYRWLFVGAFIDLVATLGISLLILFSKRIPNIFIFYGILYILLVIIVVSSESIGVYYGALEQYVLHKKEKKEISYMD